MFTPSHRGGSGPPLVLIHGFTDTWRTWDLVLPALERSREVLAPTLPGHAGGPSLNGELAHELLVDAVEQAMDAAGFGTAKIVGNSLGGFIALQLAARGRAESVVGLAPAGGWADGDETFPKTLEFFRTMQGLLKNAAQRADAIAATPEGRRQSTLYITTNYEHIPPELIAHQIRGAANCPGALPMIDYALTSGYELDSAKIECPVRIVWGTADKLLLWPAAAACFRERLGHAEWVELDGIGHCPQLDVPLETAQLILDFD